MQGNPVIHEKETSDEGFQQIVADGIHFLESIARHYGPEKSIEIWDKMGEAMGQDIKGHVFFAMLTGEGCNRVYIQGGTCNQAVAAIKCIRTYTGYGLKEAKDAYDVSFQKPVLVECSTPKFKTEMCRELRALGMRVL
jgi:hypothetical protein